MSKLLAGFANSSVWDPDREVVLLFRPIFSLLKWLHQLCNCSFPSRGRVFTFSSSFSPILLASRLFISNLSSEFGKTKKEPSARLELPR